MRWSRRPSGLNRSHSRAPSPQRSASPTSDRLFSVGVGRCQARADRPRRRRPRRGGFDRHRCRRYPPRPSDGSCSAQAPVRGDRLAVHEGRGPRTSVPMSSAESSSTGDSYRRAQARKYPSQRTDFHSASWTAFMPSAVNGIWSDGDPLAGAADVHDVAETLGVRAQSVHQPPPTLGVGRIEARSSEA